MVGYGNAAELFDRFIFLFEEELIDEETLDKNLVIWYNSDVEDMEKFNAEINPNEQGTTGANPNGGFSFGTANIPGDGKEGIRGSLEGASTSLPNRVRQVVNEGSDLLTLD